MLPNDIVIAVNLTSPAFPNTYSAKYQSCEVNHTHIPTHAHTHKFQEKINLEYSSIVTLIFFSPLEFFVRDGISSRIP